MRRPFSASRYFLPGKFPAQVGAFCHLIVYRQCTVSAFFTQNPSGPPLLPPALEKQYSVCMDA